MSMTEGTARRRLVARTWRGSTVVLVLVAVVLAASGVFAWLQVAASNYQPLVAGFGERVELGKVVETDAARLSDDTPTEVEVTYVDHAEFNVVISIRNSGSWDVAVTGVELTSPGRFALWHITAVRRVVPGKGGYLDDAEAFGPGVLNVSTEPFAPFVLKGGAEAQFLLTGRMQDCEYYMPGGGNDFVATGIDYDVWGHSHETSVRWPVTVQLRESRPYTCPRAYSWNIPHMGWTSPQPSSQGRHQPVTVSPG